MGTDPIEAARRRDVTASRGRTSAALAVDRQAADRIFDDVAVSWRRSADDYHIDPARVCGRRMSRPPGSCAALASQSRDWFVRHSRSWIVFTAWWVRPAMSCCFVTPTVLPLNTVVTRLERHSFAIGEYGSAESGRRQPREPTASARALPSSGPLPFIRPNTFVRGTARSVVPAHRYTASTPRSRQCSMYPRSIQPYRRSRMA